MNNYLKIRVLGIAEAVIAFLLVSCGGDKYNGIFDNRTEMVYRPLQMSRRLTS